MKKIIELGKDVKAKDREVYNKRQETYTALKSVCKT